MTGDDFQGFSECGGAELTAAVTVSCLVQYVMSDSNLTVANWYSIAMK